MKEFVSLDEEILEIKPKKVFDIVKADDIFIQEDSTLVDVVKLTPEKFLEDIKEDIVTVYCDADASTSYGDFDPEGYFKRDNLFSEITDEYARMQARINLGIAEAYAMKWGNLTGNILHQKDLYDFVMDNIHLNIQDLINALNLHLTKWAQEINARFETKADINSPTFTGIPKVPSPISTSNSTQIANTAWVKQRINEIVFQDLSYLNINPEMVSYEDLPALITLEWEFNNPITQLYINKVEFPIDTTSYSITITESTNIEFKYILSDGSIRIKDIYIEVRVPTYYGDNLNSLQSTLDNTIVHQAANGNYHYILSDKLDLELEVNGIIGGFTNEGIVDKHGKAFYVYKSKNHSLGKLKIKLP